MFYIHDLIQYVQQKNTNKINSLIITAIRNKILNIFLKNNCPEDFEKAIEEKFHITLSAELKKITEKTFYALEDSFDLQIHTRNHELFKEQINHSPCKMTMIDMFGKIICKTALQTKQYIEQINQLQNIINIGNESYVYNAANNVFLYTAAANARYAISTFTSLIAQEQLQQLNCEYLEK